MSDLTRQAHRETIWSRIPTAVPPGKKLLDIYKRAHDLAEARHEPQAGPTLKEGMPLSRTRAVAVRLKVLEEAEYGPGLPDSPGRAQLPATYEARALK